MIQNERVVLIETNEDSKARNPDQGTSSVSVLRMTLFLPLTLFLLLSFSWLGSITSNFQLLNFNLFSSFLLALLASLSVVQKDKRVGKKRERRRERFYVTRFFHSSLSYSTMSEANETETSRLSINGSNCSQVLS